MKLLSQKKFGVFLLLALATLVLFLISTALAFPQEDAFSYLPAVPVNDATPAPSPSPTLPAPSSDDWAMVAGNPQRTSWTPEEVTGQTNVEWYRPIEAYIPQNSQIIATGGLLYVSTARGLYALHAATGAVVWRFDTEMPLGNSPAVANGTIYVGGYDRKLHALDAETGDHLWAFAGADAGYDTNPLVVDGVIYAGNRDGKMYAIGAEGTPQAGQLLWDYQTGGPIHLSAAHQDGTIFFAASDNYAYALDADSGSLLWRSDRLPGLQYHSYWPVVYQDKVIFAAAFGYRKSMAPGTRSVEDPDGAPYSSYKEMRNDDIWPEQTDGTTLGPDLGPQDWSHGYPVLQASRLTDYLEEKPWRRLLVVLNRSDGEEYTFDSDNDGNPEYIPASFWGTGSGNIYPPIVGPDNILYFNNVYSCCGDHGYVMGWQMGDPSLLSITDIFGVTAEPQALSAGGNYIYRNMCCDRVADWFNLLNANAPNGVAWGYDLHQRAPGYDQSWTIIEGLPRLKGWYTGNTNSTNAAYHNHGDQNPLVPYQGRIYTHRSNAIIAIGPGNGPGQLPLLEAADSSYDASGDVLSEAELTARLESEIQKIMDVGHLRPGYYNVAQWLGRGLEDYFENPGDTIYVLSLAHPYLSPSLQAEVEAYLQQEFQTYFDPSMYATIGWADGAPREEMALPPEVEADLANYPPSPNAGSGFLWQYPQHNFYAMWKYAQLFPGEAGRAYDLARSKLQVPVPDAPVADYFTQQPYELNAWIAGYIGFLELQELAGSAGTDAQLRTEVTEELNRLLQLRVNNFDHDSYWYDNRFHKKHLDVAGNFMFLVPELGDYMNQEMLTQVQEAVDEYETIAPYWFVSRYESVIGEGVMSNLYNYNALFLAKAHILQESPSELTKYVDAPAFARGDLFYIHNLITALQAVE